MIFISEYDYNMIITQCVIFVVNNHTFPINKDFLFCSGIFHLNLCNNNNNNNNNNIFPNWYKILQTQNIFWSISDSYNNASPQNVSGGY
jgi:hypothetical protein